MSVKAERFIALAREDAARSTLSYKHGCLATLGGKIIARGCNTDRSYHGSRTMNCMNTTHAEINVCRMLEAKFKRNPRKLHKVILYIARADRHGGCELFQSAPCRDCSRRIKELNIKRVVYSCEDKRIESCSTVDYHSNHISYGNRYLNNILAQ